MAAFDEARRLLAKAGEDEYEYVLARLLTDPSAPDAMLDFHAQQAAERGLRLPVSSEDLRWLTPYAVLYRYDDEPGAAEEALAREEALALVRQLKEWAGQLLTEHGQRKHG